MAAAISKPFGGKGVISAEGVCAELERILACDSFAGSKRLSAFLRFIVERALADRLDEIKEYRIGAEVYGRGPQFDPRIDNIVRVEAKRLRTKLRDYYERPGRENPVRIEIPKGTYTPKFQAVPVGDRSPILSKPARSLPLRWAALVLILTATCVFAYWRFYTWGSGGKAHPSIAILGFKDITRVHGDNAWLSTALSEMLTMDLAEGGQVRTVPVDSISEMKRDLRVGDTDGLARTLLNRVRGRAGADWVVVGAYTALGDHNNGQIRLDVRVQDAQSGDTVATLSETGSERGLFELADRTAVRLRQKLGLAAITGKTPDAVLPSSPEAMRLYAEGLDRLRESNAVAAREVLDRAVAADPSNPFTYSALAAAWDALGYEVRAQESAGRAHQLASHLSRTEQLQIEGRFRVYAHQWDEAIRIYQNLCKAEPDSIDDALMLVNAERLASKPGHALATIESLRKLAPDLREDPRVDFAEARVLGDLGDFHRARESAITVERKALAIGARLLYARAKLFESGTMQNLGMPHAAEVREEARRLCADLNDRACVEQTLRVEANQILLSSSPTRAKELYGQALKISREMGYRRETLNLLEGLGAASAELDDFTSAEKAYAEGLTTARETGNVSGVNAFQMDLADILASEGRLLEANAIYQRFISLARGTGRRENLGTALTGFAKLLWVEGRRNEAQRAAEEAVRVLRPTGEVYEIAAALTILGECLLDVGDVESARKNDEEAVTLKGGARAEIASASALLEAHRARAAESRAADAVHTFQAAKRVHDEALGRAVLIRALLAEGKVHEANEVVKEQSMNNLRDPYARLVFGVAAARAQAAAGNPADALKQLSALISESSRLGYGRAASEARLAYGEITKRTHSPRRVYRTNSLTMEWVRFFI